MKTAEQAYAESEYKPDTKEIEETITEMVKEAAEMTKQAFIVGFNAGLAAAKEDPTEESE